MPNIDLRVVTVNSNLINALVFSDYMPSPRQFTSVYGAPKYGGKRSFFFLSTL